MYELFTVVRKAGLMGLEKQIEHPEENRIFQKYPNFLNNHHACNFLCDTMRLIISGAAVSVYDLEAIMDNDLETHHKEALKPSSSHATVADPLSGPGIVAAVLDSACYFHTASSVHWLVTWKRRPTRDRLITNV